jgi:serpin B
MSPDGKNLYIQDVIHEAFIAVDEDGTEAAAATAVVVGRTSAPQDVVELTVDRPFLFAIRDNDTGAILFLGRVVDPS